MLVNAKADVNQATVDGESPVYIAARKGHLGTLEVLLALGGEVSHPLPLAAPEPSREPHSADEPPSLGEPGQA